MSVPRIYGHRGDPRHHPENSLAGFRSAMALGCDGIELDVQLSAEGTPMVLHDPTLDRTTNGAGLVREHHAATLATHRLRLPPPEHGFSAERLPTLDAVLGVLPAHTDCLVELKTDADGGEAMLAATAAALRRHTVAARCALLCFDLTWLAAARRHAPDVRRAWNVAEADAYMEAREAGFPHCEAVSMPLDRITSRTVAECRAAGRDLFVWGIRTEDDVRAALRLRPDALITDLPAATLMARDCG